MSQILRSHLKILVPEYGSGGDHPTEGFLMKGLGSPDPDFFQDFETEDIPHDLEAFYSYIEEYSQEYSIPEYKRSTRANFKIGLKIGLILQSLL